MKMFLILLVMGADHFVINAKLPPLKTKTTETQATIDSCSCGGDGAKCTCPVGKCDCLGCAKHRLVENITLNVQAEAEDISWDSEYLDAVKNPPVSAMQERMRCYIYVPKWCTACPATKKAMGDGNENIEIIYKQSEVQKAEQYPAYWVPALGKFFYNYRKVNNQMVAEVDNRIEKLEELMGVADSVVGGIPAGKIPRKYIERLIPFLKITPSIALANPADDDIPIGIVKFHLPKGFKVSWVTTNGVTKFTFSEPPRLIWGWFDKRCDSITYDGSKIEFDIPKLPNPILYITGDETMSVMLPDTPRVSSRAMDMLPIEIPDGTQPALNPLAELSKSTHGPLYSHPGDVTSHLIRDHHIPASQLTGKSLREQENIHSSLHNGYRATVQQKSTTYSAAPRKMRRGNCPGGYCPG